MADAKYVFDDAEAYERFMGRWSRAVGVQFLDWFAPPKNARWLDVGCGTGIFTELILNTCGPAAMTAVDPAPAQVEHARTLPVARLADFQVADAQSLPFPDASFDVVASALVLNFIPDREKAVREMRRTTRPGASAGGYVWDFPGERMTGSVVRNGLREIGIEPPAFAGGADSTLDGLAALFQRAGFESVATRAIDVTMTFRSFDDFWSAQTPSCNPMTKMIVALPEHEQTRLREAVRRRLPTGPDGTITHSARANAVKARAPS